MIFNLLLESALTLILGLVSFLPLPEFSDFSFFDSALVTLGQLLEKGLDFVGWLLGPSGLTVFKLVWGLYLSFAAILGVLLIWQVFSWAWGFIQSFISGD